MRKKAYSWREWVALSKIGNNIMNYYAHDCRVWAWRRGLPVDNNVTAPFVMGSMGASPERVSLRLCEIIFRCLLLVI